MHTTRLIISLLFCLIHIPAWASDQHYKPAKVIYDVSSGHPDELKNTLDRASLLQKIYGNDIFESSIIIIIHEQAIAFFTRDGNHIEYSLNQRAKSLASSEIIQFRICQTSAKMQGYTEKDFDTYIKLVPMADAEIIKLQNDGYAYLR